MWTRPLGAEKRMSPSEWRWTRGRVVVVSFSVIVRLVWWGGGGGVDGFLAGGVDELEAIAAFGNDALDVIVGDVGGRGEKAGAGGLLHAVPEGA